MRSPPRTRRRLRRSGGAASSDAFDVAEGTPLADGLPGQLTIDPSVVAVSQMNIDVHART